MRICLLADGYPNKEYQFFVFVEQLVDALVNIGVDVDVIAPQSITNNLIRKHPFIPFCNTVKSSEGKKYRVFRPKIITFGNNRVFSQITKFSKKHAIKKTLKHIGISNIDAFYGHFWHNANQFTGIALKMHKPLFVACGEGDNALESLIASMSIKDKQRLRQAVTGVISVSSENKNKCTRFNLAEAKDIQVFPNCANRDIFHPLDKLTCRAKLGIDSDVFVVSFVGGFIPRKGSTRVSQALTELNDPNIKAIFIGQSLNGNISDPDYNGTIIKGQVPHDKLPEYLCASDVFVLPTLKEGCCNAIVEAVSCGIPVISSNLPFNDDILDDNYSIRIDPNSVEEIKSAILKVKNESGLKEKMSQAATQKSKDWSIVSRAKKILDFIEIQSKKLCR